MKSFIPPDEPIPPPALPKEAPGFAARRLGGRSGSEPWPRRPRRADGPPRRARPRSGEGDRWNVERFYDAEPGVAGKTIVKRGGFLDAVDQFDPQFFGISPREAPYIDPQQRLLLETAWETIEDAGLVLDLERGTDIGVFVGVSHNDYQNIQGGATDRSTIFTTIIESCRAGLPAQHEPGSKVRWAVRSARHRRRAYRVVQQGHQPIAVDARIGRRRISFERSHFGRHMRPRHHLLR